MIEASPGAAGRVGVVLAGGLGRRMGGVDKPLLSVGGRPMLEWALERLRPQVAQLVISANGSPARFARFGAPVAGDTIEDSAGPLAGILAGMRWASAQGKHVSWLLSVAGDTPFFPVDLGERLFAAAGDDAATIVLAASSGGVHPVFGLWPIALADDLERFLRSGETRKTLAFAEQHRCVEAQFADAPLGDDRTFDPFFNVNSPADLGHAEEIASTLGRMLK